MVLRHITHVELGNASDEQQIFNVLISSDEEIIHRTQRKLDAGGEEVFAIDAPEEHGHVAVLVWVVDDWDRTDFDDKKYDGERVIAVVV